MSETEMKTIASKCERPCRECFTERPAPDQPPYVEVGDMVKKKQVLALLETMKVFQKVKSPVAGKIVEIAVENETALKDEQLMFVIEPVFENFGRNGVTRSFLLPYLGSSFRDR